VAAKFIHPAQRTMSGTTMATMMPRMNAVRIFVSRKVFVFKEKMI